MLEYAAQETPTRLTVKGKDTVQKYSADSDTFASSHFILDILNRREAYNYLISFCFEGREGEDEHAIAVSFTDSEKGLLMDPNYGVARYDSRSALCSDLHSLMALHVGPSGYLSSVYLLPYKNDKNVVPEAEWTDFQSASFQSASF